MVFQSYALYPHLSVFENIAFGLKLHKMPRREIVRRVQRAAELLDLQEFLERKPRAAIGRSAATRRDGSRDRAQPAVFLMDEPLSNLDAQLRVHTRAEIGRLQRQLGTTTIYVTHDQVEAMTMGDRVAVMRNGRLQQFATPREVYDRPANVFVGGFIGSPAMNLVDGTIQRANGDITVLLGGQRLALDTSVLMQRPLLDEYQGRQVVVGIRPESVADAALAREPQEDRLLQGTVELREELGPELFVHFSAPDVQLAETATIAGLPRDTGMLRSSSDSRRSSSAGSGRTGTFGGEGPSTPSWTPGVCTSSTPRQG